MTTPTRAGSRRSISRPLSANAIPAAATPKRDARPMIFRFLRCSGGTKAWTSKSGTSAATRTGWLEASKLRMGPTPLVPATQADQNASLPMPLGLTTPRPVTTTLRIDTPPPHYEVVKWFSACGLAPDAKPQAEERRSCRSRRVQGAPKDAHDLNYPISLF